MTSTDTLDAERRHLTDSRAALRRMRERTEQLIDSGVTAGDAVSTASLHRALWQRMRHLEDDPDVPLFFGLLDYRRRLGAEHDERLHIGRRHVTGESGDEPLVIDWRAPMALPFYRARPGKPMGVQLRRRFGFSHGEMTAFEDERLDTSAVDASHSDILEAEIERPRSGPMRDIVATIQPEQDELVRADLATSLCVQGAPGTGKTAVGLHRAAYLLYAHRTQLSRQGVLVIGPNDTFLGYIGDVLPALGEIEARQFTIDSLLVDATGLTVSGVDEPATALLKGDARLAQVIDTAVWSALTEPEEALVVPRGARQFRVAGYRAWELAQELRDRGVRYGAGRELIAQRLAHEVLLRMEAAGDSPDDRVQAAVARSRAVKAYVDRLWPAVDSVKLVFRLLTDTPFLTACAQDILDDAERALLRPARVPRRVQSMAWTTADLALIDEAGDRIARTPSVGHVVLDEAQDLSPMQLRAVGRRVSTGSVTVLGDLAQATTPWASRDWTTALAHLGQSDAVVEELVAGFRVPGAVINYAARLLPVIAPGLEPPYSVRRSRGDLEFRPGGGAEVRAAVGQALEHEGTVAVIVPAERRDTIADLLTDLDDRAEVVPSTVAKGLEFDHVVLVDPEAIVTAEPDRLTGLRRLYVCLTRAVTSLQIVHAEALPDELAG